MYFCHFFLLAKYSLHTFVLFVKPCLSNLVSNLVCLILCVKPYVTNLLCLVLTNVLSFVVSIVSRVGGQNHWFKHACLSRGLLLVVRSYWNFLDTLVIRCWWFLQNLTYIRWKYCFWSLGNGIDNVFLISDLCFVYCYLCMRWDNRYRCIFWYI